MARSSFPARSLSTPTTMRSGLNASSMARSFAQELGVGGDVEIDVRAGILGHGPLELFRGVHRHGAFLDEQAVAGHVLGDLAADLFDVGHVGLAPIARRGADGDEDDLGERGAFLDGRRELQPAGGDVAVNHFFEPRLVDGHFAAFQDLDLALVVVHAQHVVADLGEAGARNQSDVSGSNNCDFHGESASNSLRQGATS